MNKATQSAREAIAAITDGMADQVQSWLIQVAKTSPGKALDIYCKLLDFHVPRLARIEHTGGVTITHEEALRQLIGPDDAVG